MKKKIFAIASGMIAVAAWGAPLSDADNKLWEAGQIVTTPDELLSDFLALTNTPGGRIESPSTPPKRTAAEAPAEDAAIRLRVRNGDKTVIPILLREAAGGNKEAADLLVGAKDAMLVLGEAIADRKMAATALDIARRRKGLEFRQYARRLLFAPEADVDPLALAAAGTVGCGRDEGIVAYAVEALSAESY